MPPATTRQQFQAMLQDLLIERFRIQLHHETRTFPGYELTVRQGGSKLKPPADPDAPESDEGPAGGTDKEGFPLLPTGHGKGVVMAGTGVYAKFQNCTLGELIPYLRSFLKLAAGAETNHVVDKTGLDGKYDYTLRFDTRGGEGKVAVGRGLAADSPDSANAPSGLPDLIRAVENQLGLKLVKANGFPLDTIVIDRIEKTPIEN
jgi:uncharacterized protein (TIGR03435 family)